MSENNGTPTPPLPTALPDPPYPMIAPTRIHPSAVPLSVGLGMVSTPEGEPYVVMQISTPTGLAYTFLKPHEAVKIGEGLVQLGSKSGIAVVREGSPLAQALANAAFNKKNR